MAGKGRESMRVRYGIWLVVVVFFGLLGTGQTWASGEELFQKNCSVCHKIGSRFIGPDLSDVQTRRSLDWIVKFVQSSQSMIKNGDAQAVALFEEFGKMPMPDQPLSVEEVQAILAYIKGLGVEKQAVPDQVSTQKVEPKKLTEKDVWAGLNLFQGKLRFEKGGPSCISCHDLKNDAVIGGGILAKDLTAVFTRLSGTGVAAILGGPPFPVMQEAYRDYPLAEKEIKELVGFLQYADEHQYYQRPRDYGWGLFTAGIFGVVLLFGIFALMWRYRRKDAVNQAIFGRQVKSE